MRPKPRLSRCTNMAAGQKRTITILAFILCLSLGQAAARNKTFPTAASVEKWSDNLGNNLINLLNTITGYLAINTSYNSDDILKNVQFKEVDEQQLVKNMADKLSVMLSKKMDALWELVGAAEAAAEDHNYTATLKKDDVDFYNSKDMGDVELEFDLRFDQEVNFNFSSVHIPVEIYDGNIQILNGLQWTEKLDEQFKKNYAEDEQMLWQFFGSQTGFMRTYPASRWNTHGPVDLFDVRRQSWYTQGSSSPKDMMILIDTSGSTHGQALQLMKNAVKSILDTLGENDFVNIVEFSQTAKIVSDCFNETAFVQANYRNKKQLEKDVDKLKANGQANYQVGLRFAFKKFEEFSQNRTESGMNIGANCNKVIILLTDGGTDNAEEVFDEYNWPNKSVRVFTYAVGPTATPVAAIRWMACANRGYFSQIPAMGAIRARVQEHTHYLKQGMEQLNVQPNQWEITVNPRGLGMMTTVTLPVYNRSQESSNQTILGVMGIDVPTTELGKRTPYVAIGPVGYSFAINPNGYAVFHPNLKRTGRYMKDPPNIDLLELELEQEGRNKLMELRNRMIEGEKAKQEIDALFLSQPDRKYVTPQTSVYTFTNITNTTFRLGLSVPKFQRWYPYFSSSSLPDVDMPAHAGAHDRQAFLIAPWDYLGTLPEQLELDSSLDSLVSVLKSGSLQASQLTPDQLQLLHHLAMDVKVGNDFDPFFPVLKSQNATNSSVDGSENNESYVGFSMSNVLLHFVAMNGGLTIVYPAEAANQFEEDRDLRNSTYYKRAMQDTHYIFSTDSSNYNKTHPAIMATRSVSVAKYGHRIAVTGVKLDAEGLRDYMMGVLKEKTEWEESHLHTLTCGDEDHVVCYLVDDGAFLVSSNQDNETIFAPGKFLGEIDPELWNFLYTNKSVFGRTVEYDFQAVCTVRQDTTSAGHRSFLVPSVNLMYEALTTSWWTRKITWAYTSFNIYNWIFGSAEVHGEDAEVEEEDCVLASQQFYLHKNKTKMGDAIPCGSESRQVVTGPVIGTNMILVMAQHPCNPETAPIKHGPYKISEDEEEELVCTLAKHPRKRVQSYGCYDNDPQEDDSKCGAPSLPSGNLVAVMVACLTVIVVSLLSSNNR